jgi:hypothetical protein
MSKLDAERQGLIDILEKRTTLLEKTIAEYKAALASSEKIETVDTRLIQSYEQSLKDAKAEIARQTARAGFWQKVASFGITGALVVGALVGFIAGSR